MQQGVVLISTFVWSVAHFGCAKPFAARFEKIRIQSSAPPDQTTIAEISVERTPVSWWW